MKESMVATKRNPHAPKGTVPLTLDEVEVGMEVVWHINMGRTPRTGRLTILDGPAMMQGLRRLKVRTASGREDWMSVYDLGLAASRHGGWCANFTIRAS